MAKFPRDMTKHSDAVSLLRYANDALANGAKRLKKKLKEEDKLPLACAAVAVRLALRLIAGDNPARRK